MQLENLNIDSLAKIAWALTDAHGMEAINFANKAITELEDEGYNLAADAWRGVRFLVEDALCGRINRRHVTIH